MKQEELDKIENELKKRWDFPYEWGRIQNDVWDRHSSFIYSTSSWDILRQKCEDAVKSNGLNRREFLNYAFNRWYNYWSAVAVEKIFTTLPGIVPEFNKTNRLVDFNFFGKDFDLKTSVFPKGFGRDLTYCREHPEELILWLYKNQSAQQRQHYANRLFLIVFSEAGNHWKLKAEISWLKQIVTEYVA
ncbi:hypothetical protein LZ575_15205 [Antarcticibacterium sp. 1MA-6-2]|uniref:hypothetical protein n=1 Tax=Antarcticibacterium sp. 1MA-6-2 TaxID=2908210 RepID=UPI001F2B3F33|nr:hypothetical protein [Antarcticibacterium sp. 1MA-6-2]UJH90222.1 hypothetical protein LZ575_15205 [Antarcticibacterium sp. 1MA-6-2]